jgi:hypothetical protein
MENCQFSGNVIERKMKFSKQKRREKNCQTKTFEFKHWWKGMEKYYHLLLGLGQCQEYNGGRES